MRQRPGVNRELDRSGVLDLRQHTCKKRGADDLAYVERAGWTIGLKPEAPQLQLATLFAYPRRSSHSAIEECVFGFLKPIIVVVGAFLARRRIVATTER